jgi:hypothetical protein
MSLLYAKLFFQGSLRVKLKGRYNTSLRLGAQGRRQSETLDKMAREREENTNG